MLLGCRYVLYTVLVWSYHEGHNDPVNLQLVAQTEWTE